MEYRNSKCENIFGSIWVKNDIKNQQTYHATVAMVFNFNLISNFMLRLPTQWEGDKFY